MGGAGRGGSVSTLNGKQGIDAAGRCVFSVMSKHGISGMLLPLGLVSLSIDKAICKILRLWSHSALYLSVL